MRQWNWGRGRYVCGTRVRLVKLGGLKNEMDRVKLSLFLLLVLLLLLLLFIYLGTYLLRFTEGCCRWWQCMHVFLVAETDLSR